MNPTVSWVKTRGKQRVRVRIGLGSREGRTAQARRMVGTKTLRLKRLEQFKELKDRVELGQKGGWVTQPVWLGG